MMNFIYLVGLSVASIVAYEYQVLHVGFELAGDGFHILSDLANSNTVLGVDI